MPSGASSQTTRRSSSRRLCQEVPANPPSSQRPTKQMTAPTPYATAEGSLYELVSRGKKDVFFFGDLSDSKFIFDNTYAAQRPNSFEIRRIPPRTAAEFGRTVDFDFDLIGDILRAPTILIDLPTWLPHHRLPIERKAEA